MRVFYNLYLIENNKGDNKNQMNDRLKNLNKKISKSTIQMQRLISQITSPEKPPQFSSRNRQSLREAQLYPSNPQQFPQLNNLKQFNDLYGMKNSNIETNASTKFQESKEHFNNTYRNAERNNFKSTSVNMHQTRRNRDEIGHDTKFAIGHHLYPANSQFKTQIQKAKNTSRVIVAEPQKQLYNRKLGQLDYTFVLQYAMSKTPLTPQSKPEEIFDYFYEFASYFSKPLIKKFKNCLYFGESIDSSKNGSKYRTKYSGFLYFFNLKIYYGGFQEEYKSGFGVEINLKTGVTYKGNFVKGHKIGKFTVYSDSMIYEGYLQKGKYHGVGRLETPISIYVGQFFNGMRNGEGQQYFFKSGLKLRGIFQMDKFCNKGQQNHERQNQDKRLKNRQINRSSQKQRPFPKIHNAFQFSFHDESEEEPDFSNKKHQIKWSIKKMQPTQNLFKRKPQYENCEMEDASDDDPLPPPFRKICK